jgi:hypothetical protein
MGSTEIRQGGAEWWRRLRARLLRRLREPSVKGPADRLGSDCFGKLAAGERASLSGLGEARSSVDYDSE